ncbi:Plug domain-containing protein [Gammaproteobacteria bacterium]|nr:Plug domain-containing protein [Gammaproteobacteria bacterium]
MPSKYSYKAAAAILMAASVALPASSIAEDGASSRTIEEVVVTATRRAESLQDVPISISVVGADDILATGSTDMKELSAMVPNFVFAESPNQGLSFIAIRGMYSRTEPQDLGFDSSVGVYVDGVFHSRQFNANANMGEVERVEVLRGPQVPYLVATQSVARLTSPPKNPLPTNFLAIYPSMSATEILPMLAVA